MERVNEEEGVEWGVVCLGHGGNDVGSCLERVGAEKSGWRRKASK